MKRCLAVLCSGALVGLAACGSVGSPVPADKPTGSKALQARLDAALRKGRRFGGAPAATGAVVRCGRLLWSGASGVRSVKSRARVSPNTLFVIASATKPFTAALVLKLVERGRLSLNTKLARFYPALPNATEITIRMLLEHTSGLSEYFDDPHISRVITDPRHRWTRAEVLRGITGTKFEPGARYSYSNSGYVVLGGIVEKLTGDTIEQVFQREIARPLGLSHSTFTYRPRRSYLFAHPYLRKERGLQDAFAPGVGVPSDFWGPVWTDGGLASTSVDLARFGDALFAGQILRPSTVRGMTRANRFDSRLGIEDKTFGGHEWLGHDGRYLGYESELWHDRSRDLSVAVHTDAEESSLAAWKAVVGAYDRVAPKAPRCGSALRLERTRRTG